MPRPGVGGWAPHTQGRVALSIRLSPQLTSLEPGLGLRVGLASGGASHRLLPTP